MLHVVTGRLDRQPMLSPLTCLCFMFMLLYLDFFFVKNIVCI